MKTKAEIDALIADLAEDLKPAVQEIEGSIKTTQNHYGRYMSLLSLMGDGKPDLMKILGVALIKAGANRGGVNSAMKILQC
jgi:hypothetical protein